MRYFASLNMTYNQGNSVMGLDGALCAPSSPINKRNIPVISIRQQAVRNLNSCGLWTN